LNNSGLYFIEDLHCSYFSGHGGGFHEPLSALNWLKSLVDGLHYDHFLDDESVPLLVRAALNDLNKSLKRITFYDSIAVIEKLADEKTRPYHRILSGKTATVQPFENWIPDTPSANLSALRIAKQTGQEIDAALLKILDLHRLTETTALQRLAECKEELEKIRSDFKKLATPETDSGDV
jgi:hypothetical protein